MSDRESSDSADSFPEERSIASVAASWASRIMTISLGMVLPGLAGYWLDGYLGTKVLFMLIGFALGSVYAMLQLLGIARQGVRRANSSDGQKEERSGN